METIHFEFQQTLVSAAKAVEPELCHSDDAETHKYSHYPSRD
jgi:hypothetical protein